MRKSLWIILAVLVVAVGAPNAHADTLFEYTVTNTGMNQLGANEFTFTTVPIPVTDLFVTIPASDLSTSSLTGSNFVGCTLTSVVLNGGIELNLSGTSCAPSPAETFGDGFALTDYSTPGTYEGIFNTLVVTGVNVATPEPSSVGLLLLGIGLVFMARKHTVQGLSRAI